MYIELNKRIHPQADNSQQTKADECPMPPSWLLGHIPMGNKKAKAAWGQERGSKIRQIRIMTLLFTN